MKKEKQESNQEKLELTERLEILENRENARDEENKKYAEELSTVRTKLERTSSQLENEKEKEEIHKLWFRVMLFLLVFLSTHGFSIVLSVQYGSGDNIMQKIASFGWYHGLATAGSLILGGIFIGKRVALLPKAIGKWFS